MKKTKKVENHHISKMTRLCCLCLFQVIELECKNKQLEEKQKILMSRQDHTRKVNEIVIQANKGLEEQVETLAKDQVKLEGELAELKAELDTINRRSAEFLL